MKATKVSGGYVIKRKARVEHECYDCGCCIVPGEEYYQLSLEHFYPTPAVNQLILSICGFSQYLLQRLLKTIENHTESKALHEDC